MMSRNPHLKFCLWALIFAINVSAAICQFSSFGKMSIDNIQRQKLDNTINGHGKMFIDFLLDTKSCVLNGRFNAQENNFTCVHKD